MLTSLSSISDSLASEPVCTSEELNQFTTYKTQYIQAIMYSDYQRAIFLEQKFVKQITPRCLNALILYQRQYNSSVGEIFGSFGYYSGIIVFGSGNHDHNYGRDFKGLLPNLGGGGWDSIIGTESTGPRAIETPKGSANEN